MRKFAKIINNETKECEVGIGTNSRFYESIGMTELDVAQSENGAWYLNGFVPAPTPKSYIEKRLEEYPPLSDQLDMIYWDKVNGTNLWQEKIAEIKAKYPKE